LRLDTPAPKSAFLNNYNPKHVVEPFLASQSFGAILNDPHLTSAETPPPFVQHETVRYRTSAIK
jgi:hypothetical protein